jgi:hypothetical protein
MAVIPKANAPKQRIDGLEVIAVDRLEQAIDRSGIWTDVEGKKPRRSGAFMGAVAGACAAGSAVGATTRTNFWVSSPVVERSSTVRWSPAEAKVGNVAPLQLTNALEPCLAVLTVTERCRPTARWSG